MSDTEDHELDESEAPAEGQQAMEDLQRRKDEKLKDEMEEYREMRKEEKEREARELEEMKRKKAERIKEREEEEKRLVVQRKEEDLRRKADEEERKKKKEEEELTKRQEKERRRREAEKRQGPKVPNFTIVRKEGEQDEGTQEDTDRVPTKSKEQLENEKQNALAQRITPLNDMDGFTVEQLAEAAKELHDQIRSLVSQRYQLEERVKRGQYDVVEMQERARAMSKTKKRGVSCVQVDDSYDRMNDRFSNAPPKILVANKYEGNLDRRSWKEKVDSFNTKEDFDIALKPYYAFK